MKQHVCPYCGYVYSPALGDSLGNVPPYTSFSDLLDSWSCPRCHAGKKAFKSLVRAVPESEKYPGKIGKEKTK